MKKALGILFLLPLLHGCVMATKVSAVGLRAQSARLEIVPGQSSYKATIKESQFVSEGFSVDTFPIPYVSLVKGPESGSALPVEIQPSNVKWQSQTGSRSSGKISLKTEKGIYTFSADGRALKLVSNPASFSQPEIIFFEREYRQWYGYPAQALLPVALAADLVGGVVTVLVVAPAVHIKRALSPGAPNNSFKADTKPLRGSVRP